MCSLIVSKALYRGVGEINTLAQPFSRLVVWMDCCARVRLWSSSSPPRDSVLSVSSVSCSLRCSSHAWSQEIIADVFSNAIESLSEDDRKLPQVTFAAFVLCNPVTHAYAPQNDSISRARVYDFAT